MPFCSKCGKELANDAKFCSNCGHQVDVPTAATQTQRKQTFDGETRKCPNCGAELNASKLSCPICGFEPASSRNQENGKDNSIDWFVIVFTICLFACAALILILDYLKG